MADQLDVPLLTAWLGRAAAAIEAQQGYLSDLDAAIGDGDHGANLARGFKAVMAKLGTPADPAALFRTVGMTLIGTVGGASGPLYGTLFMAIGKGMPERPTRAESEAAFAQGLAAVKARGKSDVGQKTMLDVLAPALAAFEAGSDAPALAQAAERAAEATAPLRATRGRASFLGERSIGHVDPGARSSALMISALCEEWTR